MPLLKQGHKFSTYPDSVIKDIVIKGIQIDDDVHDEVPVDSATLCSVKKEYSTVKQPTKKPEKLKNCYCMDGQKEKLDLERNNEAA